MSTQAQPLSTKLRAVQPRMPLVPRPRLLERLREGITRKLTLVAAPAGFSKTTLLGEWTREAGWPVAWVSLEAGDNDPPRFWSYVVAALQTLQPGLGQNALALCRAAGPSPAPWEPALTALINDLDQLAGDWGLVLDDYHVIASESIHAGMAFFIEHLPPQLHLVIGSRAEPPLPLARLRARGELTEIRAQDLRFRFDEALAFLNGLMGLDLAVEDVATLAERTEGWVSGLQLAGLSLRTAPSPERQGFVREFAGSQRDVADYLLEEVFNRQPAEIQVFLLQTCILDRLCGSVCDAVILEPARMQAAAGGQAMLEWLEEAGLFILPLDNRRQWYRYHHLFAGALRERLRQIHPEWLPTLHARASAWFERHGTAAEAINHALAGNDFQRAAWLLAQVAEAMLWQRGEIATLMGWLAALPPEAKRPWSQLCLTEAWLLLWNGQLTLVEPLLEYVVATAPTAAVAGQVATIRAELARLRGDLPQAVDFARRALAALPPENTPARAMSLGILAGVHHAFGDVVAAQRAYAEANALMMANGQIVPALISAGSLIDLWALQGQPQQAAEVYRELLHYARMHGASSLPPIGVAHIRMGEMRRRQNDVAEAQRLLSEGVGLCLQWEGLADYALEGCLDLSDLFLSLGEEERADGYMRQAEELARGPEVPPMLRSHQAARRARQWLRQGRLLDAIRWMETCGLHPSDEPSPAQRAEYIVMARVLMAGRERWAAGRLLDHLLSVVESAQLAGEMIEVSLLQALIFHGEAETPKAMQALAAAVALAQRTGYVQAFVEDGRSALPLLIELEGRGVAKTFVSELHALAAGARSPAHSSTAGPPPLVEPLTSREEEVLRLTAAGLSAPEIAGELVISAGTVRAHLKNIYGKLDIHNRVQAADAARRLGLL